jgi:fumarate reductase subunit C
MTEKSFEPAVWGPHFWFILMTMAVSYPLKANETTQKKYYDFITNLPLFIPHPQIGNKFSCLLDKYPVSPYLEGKDSFLKWVNFIHNKINIQLGKDEMTLTEALDAYYELYKPKEIIMREQIKYRKKLIFGCIISGLLIGGYYLYKK